MEHMLGFRHIYVAGNEKIISSMAFSKCIERTDDVNGSKQKFFNKFLFKSSLKSLFMYVHFNYFFCSGAIHIFLKVC